MKTLLSILGALVAGPVLLHAAAPAVSNVRAVQRAGTKLVDIYYDVSNVISPVYISIAVSTNGGATFDLPASTFTGDVGASVTPASGRKITWNAGADWPGKFSAKVRFRITADDASALPAPSGMALIPAGSFTMGDNLDGDTNAMPLHTVNVSAFYMDQYLVTKALWDQVYSWAVTHGYNFGNAGSGKAVNHPVNNVNWYDCLKWCNARSEMEGRVPAYYTSLGQTTVYRTGQMDIDREWVRWDAGYRLPTDAEWERAARGGLVGKRFPWGDTISHKQANYYSDSAYFYDTSATRGYHPDYQTNGFPFTSPVGSFAPNGYGLYDMAGNVWEWCWDLYGSYSSETQTDPRGPTSGPYRVVRGDGWYDIAVYCRTANHRFHDPTLEYYGIGFRAILPPSQSSSSPSPSISVDTQGISITSSPQNQTVMIGSSVAFSVSASGMNPEYQWFFNDSPISGATSASFVLTRVGFANSGHYYVRVANIAGSMISRSASLAVLGDASPMKPNLPIYSTLTPKPPAKDSLVLLTHGWDFPASYMHSQPSPDDVPWLYEMAACISNYINGQNLGNWEVRAHVWVTNAFTRSADGAFNNGLKEGVNLANDIVAQGWSHVHLIGHSAGAALVQAAAEMIKSNSPSTVVHTTFLDPFLRSDYIGRSSFGRSSDWADCYYAHDLLTDSSGNVVAKPSLTDGPLDYTYNVDVTALDIYSGTIREFLSSHDWPHTFYTNTVFNTLSGTEGLGFPLSKEGGGWGNRGLYPAGNTPRALGSTTMWVEQRVVQTAIGGVVSFVGQTTAQSPFGTVLLKGSSATLLTGWGTQLVTTQKVNSSSHTASASPEPAADSPGDAVWLSVAIEVTNPVNFVTFNAQFANPTGALGQLSVFCNTNLLGTVDERVVMPGMQNYYFSLPLTVTNGVYALGFRLDPYTPVQSAICITNIATGFSGISIPTQLELCASGKTNGPLLKLTGAAGYNYLIQGSTNLARWEPLATVMNSNGTVQFLGPTATNANQRFYRALLP